MTNSSTSRRVARNIRSALRTFLAQEAAGGMVLMAAAAFALIFANSELAHAYFAFLHQETGPVLAPAIGPMTVHLWINDGLMAVFFLFVGRQTRHPAAHVQPAARPACLDIG